MNEKELLTRVEEQAVEIADLKKQVETLQTALELAGPNARRNLIREMQRRSVNCGNSSGCWLARQYDS